MPCDRDLSTIKHELKKHDRIYSVEEIRALIITSSKQGKFMVKEVQTEEILNFKDWWPRLYKKSCISEETRSRAVPKNEKFQFGISSLMHFSYDNNLPGTVLASHFIDSLIKHTFRLAHDSNDIPALPTSLAYPEGKVPIKKTKIQDISKLKPYIPQEYDEFYSEILEWPTVDILNVEDQDD